MKKVFAITLCFLMIFTFAACSASEKDKGYPLTIGDTVITAKPQKIAVTSKALAEVMVSLGYGDITVDATEQFLTGVGDLTAGDPKIDLVLTNEPLYHEQAKILTNLNVSVIELDLPKSFTDLREFWQQIGAIANGTKGSVSATDMFDRKLAEVRSLPSHGDTTAILLQDMEHCAVSGLEAEAVLTAGYKNAAADKTDGLLSNGELLSLNSDVIFCAKGLKEHILADESLSELSAVKNEMIFEIDTLNIRFGSDKLFAQIKAMNSAVSVTEDTSSEAETESFSSGAGDESLAE